MEGVDAGRLDWLRAVDGGDGGVSSIPTAAVVTVGGRIVD